MQEHLKFKSTREPRNWILGKIVLSPKKLTKTRNEDFLVSPQFKLRSHKIVTEKIKRQKRVTIALSYN